MIRILPLLLAPAVLGACTTAGAYTPLERMPVAIGESVPVGALRASPLSVLEDSRCPARVQCVWAGRLVVSTRIDGPGWSETVPLALDEPHVVQGRSITLTAAHPEKIAERAIPRREYRFVFVGDS